MALFVDADHVSQADLLAIDPEIPDIAEAEGINTGQVIRQSWDECADALLAVAQRFGSGATDWTSGYTLRNGAGSGNIPAIQLSQIVVSPQDGRRISPLRRWMIYQALGMFYRAAANRRVTDRYQGKLDANVETLKWRWRDVFSHGIPVVTVPLPCPGAVHELDAGDFTDTGVTAVAGGSAAATDAEVSITWVDETSYVSQEARRQGESGPSTAVQFTIPANSLLRVDISGLVPPGSVPYQGGTANGIRSYRKATGWNVYVGTPGGSRYLQNAAPIALTSTTYTLAAAPVLSGYIQSSGQVPDVNLTLQNTFQRG
jgi:hypothetical protein